jgi:hypothetical protein
MAIPYQFVQFLWREATRFGFHLPNVVLRNISETVDIVS